MSMVFISHASEDAGLATAIEQLLREVTNGALNVRNSSSEDVAARIAVGDDWLAWIHDQVKNTDTTVVLLTARSVANRWVLWETGAIWGAASAFGKKDTLLPVCVGIPMSDIPEPLQRIQAANVSSEVGIHQFLLRLIEGTLSNNKAQQCQSFVRLGQKKGFGEYFKAVENYISSQATLFDYADVLRSLLESKQLQQSSYKHKPTLALAYSQYLERVTERIKSWQDRPLVVPSPEYPHYLIRFQEVLKVRVDAVAFVDDVERFWARRLGHQILESSDRGRTRRVFAIRNEHDLRDYAIFLSEHSQKYDVRVISVDEIRTRHSDFARDFSILSTSDTDRVLARYVNDRHDIGIEFTSDFADTNLHINAFEHIWESAFPVTNSPNLDVLVESVFAGPRLEMSRYIEVEKYDLHEEKHPYYIEMMEMMIRLCEQFRNSEFTKVLEMGAGTGHLTKRLVETFSTSGRVTAMEYDSKCYSFLIGKREIRSHASHCEIIHADSRLYDPPGKFDLILSSFADHHIVRSEIEADEYFSNIKRNLHSGASFVVGDEFLPQHSILDEKGNASAILAYHGHIIDEARVMRELAPNSEKCGYDILMELEKEAMESGLRKEGDFKVSLSNYLLRLERNGLRYDEPIPIGPLDESLRNRVGGIYVIRAYI